MGAFDIGELSEILIAPEDGEQQLKGHDKEFAVLGEGYDDLRDTINSAVDKINALGLVPHITNLPEKSLEEYIVFPLSGNYRHIQANGAACKNVSTAMETWAQNFGMLGAQSFLAFEGRAHLSFKGQLLAYGLVAAVLSEAVGTGTTVFNDIAKVSEEIAIEVEKIVIQLGKRLTRVAMKLTTRVLSYFGWLLLAKDIAERGIDAITDIVNDVTEAYELIQTCFELVGAVKEWADHQAERLAAFEELVDIVKRLPDVGPLQTLYQLGHLDLAPFQHLNPPGFGASHGPAEDDLDQTLDGAVADSGYSSDGTNWLDRLQGAVTR